MRTRRLQRHTQGADQARGDRHRRHGAAGAPGPIPAAFAEGAGSIQSIIDGTVTAEALAVTYLTGLIQNASATGLTELVSVLKAVNQSERDPLPGAGETRSQADDPEVLSYHLVSYHLGRPGPLEERRPHLPGPSLAPRHAHVPWTPEHHRAGRVHEQNCGP